jgi:hypothetical protein
MTGRPVSSRIGALVPSSPRSGIDTGRPDPTPMQFTR